MTSLPAVVTITDLPTGTTISGAELLECVQTVAGVQTSVQKTLSQLMTTVTGALPIGGSDGQLLMKSGATNFVAGWSVINLATTASLTGVLPVANGGQGTSTLTSNAVLLGAGTATLGQVAPATAGWLLGAQGTGSAPAYQQVNLGSVASLTGVLTVPLGGSGTSTLTSRAVLLGGATATATLGFAQVSTAGNILVDQGTAANPAFRAVGGDVVMSSAGTATVTTNAITFAKFQQVSGLSVAGVVGTATANAAAIAGGTSQVLGVSLGGTTLGFTGAPSLLSSVLIGSLSALPAGGNTTLGYKMTTANFGLFYGSGAPSLACGTGSIYLRSDGASATTRLYTALTAAGGTTSWTALVASA